MKLINECFNLEQETWCDVHLSGYNDGVMQLFNPQNSKSYQTYMNFLMHSVSNY